MKKAFKTCVCTLLVITFFIYVLMQIQISNVEVSVVGWEYNITRNTSQYVLSNNLSALILPDHFCNHESLLLVIVCSSPSNFDARNAIRETWGSQKSFAGANVSLFFLLGESVNSPIQKEVVQESAQHGDIIVERFVDSYNNLTLKSGFMLKLVNNYCANNTKYLFKIDDDMFVNMPILINTLLESNQTTNALFGKLICGARPIKDTNSKWYSPRYMYQEKFYPNYLSGTGYVMSVDVAEKLYKTALQTPIFHLEDVYLTGICAKKAHIKPKNNPWFTYQKLNYDSCLILKLITAHRFSPSDIRKTYTLLDDPSVAKLCSLEKNVFNINHWIMTNILKVNKTKRKSKCE